jgi:hypothetical protein
MGDSLAPGIATPWMENTLTAQAMTMVPPWIAAPWLDTGLPSELRRAHQEGQRAQARA